MSYEQQVQAMTAAEHEMRGELGYIAASFGVSTTCVTASYQDAGKVDGGWFWQITVTIPAKGKRQKRICSAVGDTFHEAARNVGEKASPNDRA